MRRALLLAVLVVVAVAIYGAVRSTPASETYEGRQVDVDGGAPETASPQTGRTPAPMVPVAGAIPRIIGRAYEADPGAPRELWTPARGATIRSLAAADGLVGEPGEPSVESDDEGRFTIDIDPEGGRALERVLEIEADAGFQRARQHVAFAAGPSRTDGVELVRYRRPHLRGRAVDPSGLPVSGARVRARDDAAAAFGEAITDAEGRFTLAAASGRPKLVADRDGWLLVHVNSPAPLEDGEWSEALVVLAREAELIVRVEDLRGQPIEGEAVSATPSPAEPYGVNEAFGKEHAPPRAKAVSGPDGLARLTGLPASMRLRVDGCEVVLPDPAGGPPLLSLDRAAPAGVPIVLPPSSPGDSFEALMVVQRHGLLIEVAGRALEPDGRPSPAASVSVVGVTEEGHVHLGSGSADEAGSFALPVRLSPSFVRLLVIGESRVGAEPSYSPFGGTKRPDPLHAGFVERPVPTSGALGEFTLRFEVLPALEGRVLDAAGAPIACQVDLTASPANRAVLPLAFVGNTARYSDAEGRFRYAAVLPGEFHIEARSERLGTTAVEGVRPGAGALELRFGEAPEPATVRISVLASEPIQRVSILTGRLAGPLNSTVAVPPLHGFLEITDPVGWPVDVIALWSGAQHTTSAVGRMQYAVGPISGLSVERTLTPGVHAFGARATLASGVACFPAGTGPVEVGSGEHELRIHLHSAGSLSGRAIVAGGGSLSDRLLSVALALPSGELVQVEARRDDMEAVSDLGAAGTFNLNQVPAGELEVRVGHPAELAAGGALARQRVVVPTGGRAECEIVLR